MPFGESPIRSLPRVFVPGADPSAPIPLPKDELDKLRRVLRLGQGAHVAVLPGDGTLIRCELSGKAAIPLAVEVPDTESRLKVTIAQALPKGDRLDTVVRCCTELGAAAFVLFPADRSVVRWAPEKLAGRLERFQSIAREAAEQSFRTRVPAVEWCPGLNELLSRFPDAVVLSELEGIERTLAHGAGRHGTDPATAGRDVVLVVGPEGGWAPRELDAIGDRGVTLGPRVLRVDTAAIAAAALLLLDPSQLGAAERASAARRRGGLG